jgi:nucleoside permease NupC
MLLQIRLIREIRGQHLVAAMLLQDFWAFLWLKIRSPTNNQEQRTKNQE